MTAVVVLQGGEGEVEVAAAMMAVVRMPRLVMMLVLDEKAPTLLRARNKDIVMIIVIVSLSIII